MYEDINIRCVNQENFYPWPTPRELFLANLVSRHVVLTSHQLEKLGYPSKKLSKLVKKGVLYRYEVFSHDRKKLPSIYTAGNTARIISKLPVPMFPNIDVLRCLLLINQVFVSILLQTEAEINMNIRRPVQFIKVNKPLGVFVAKNESYTLLPIRYDIGQAIVILPNENLALSGFPFRYVLEREMEYDCFDIKYYFKSEKRLVPVKVLFEKEWQISDMLVTPNNREKLSADKHPALLHEGG